MMASGNNIQGIIMSQWMGYESDIDLPEGWLPNSGFPETGSFHVFRRNLAKIDWAH